jgi:hypothetical protein
MMLIDEFANTRMWAAEAERQEREREQARQVREHGRWLRSAGRKVRAEATDSGTSAAQPPEATRQAEASASQERELAHAGR